MNDLFYYLNIVLIISVFFYNKKQNLLTLPSIHFLLMNVISVIVYYHNTSLKERNLSSDMHMEWFYLGVYLCSFLSIIIIPKERISKASRDITIVNGGFLKNKSLIKFICLISILNFIALIFFILSANTDILFLNYRYLRMTDVDYLGIKGNFLLVIYQRTLVLNGLLSFFMYGLLKSFKNKLYLIPKILCFTIGAFFYIYQLGNNSRSGGLILMGLIVPIIILEKKTLKRKIKIALLFFLVLTSYKSAIYGRGKMEQGISRVPTNIINSYRYKRAGDLEFIFTNIFGGAMTFVEAKKMSGKYPEEYKLLSFSPLPSSIDHFARFKKYQQRISVYEPYSANVEVYHFGGIYILFYFIILTIGLKILNKAVRKNKFIGLMLSLPAYLFFIGYQQYPLRSNFRYFFIAILFSLIYLSFKKGSKTEIKNIEY